MKRIILNHNTEPDPDGEKHEWLRYKYKDYIFNKEWYINMENEYVMGITIFKKDAKFKVNPYIIYKNNKYYEVFHSGNAKDITDDEIIKIVEMLILKYQEGKE